MSEQTAEATATGTEGTEEQSTKPTETVEFWKAKAREQEKRAKDNADAAKRLAEIEDAQKSESQKSAERIAAAEAEVAQVPAKVAEALRTHLVELHQIDAGDAELFLTATDPELLLKQVTRLLAHSDERKQNGNHVPTEGKTPTSAKAGADREYVRQLFASVE